MRRQSRSISGRCRRRSRISRHSRKVSALPGLHTLVSHRIRVGRIIESTAMRWSVDIHTRTKEQGNSHSEPIWSRGRMRWCSVQARIGWIGRIILISRLGGLARWAQLQIRIWNVFLKWGRWGICLRRSGTLAAQPVPSHRALIMHLNIILGSSRRGKRWGRMRPILGKCYPRASVLDHRGSWIV